MIVTDPDGRPRPVVSGTAAQAAAKRGISRRPLSPSRGGGDDGIAPAMVVAERLPADQGSPA